LQVSWSLELPCDALLPFDWAAALYADLRRAAAPLVPLQPPVPPLTVPGKATQSCTHVHSAAASTSRDDEAEAKVDEAQLWRPAVRHFSGSAVTLCRWWAAESASEAILEEYDRRSAATAAALDVRGSVEELLTETVVGYAEDAAGGVLESWLEYLGGLSGNVEDVDLSDLL